MQLSWPDTGAWPALAAAISTPLGAALARLGLGPRPLPVIRAGSATGPMMSVAPGAVLLSPRLAAGPIFDPADAALGPLALDRFRRTIGLVLEGVATMALSADAAAVEGLPADLWRAGRVALAVDDADPHLGWLWPSLWHLRMSPDRGLAACPRAAAWWLRFAGDDPSPDPVRWRRFGQWVRDDQRGPAGACSHGLGRARAVDVLPQRLPALSHGIVRVHGGPVGAVLMSGAASVAYMSSGESRDEVVQAVEAGPLDLSVQPPGLTGRWVLTTATMAGELSAGRGVALVLGAGGHASLVLADAFAGAPTAAMLEMARRYGVSGSVEGRWSLTRHAATGGGLQFAGLRARGLTVHPRQPGGFAMPADAWRPQIDAAINALQGAPVDVTADVDSLVLTVAGGRAVLRFERA